MSTKIDILADLNNREKTVEKFAKKLKSLKVDYLVAAQPRDVSLAGMIFVETSLPMSHYDVDGALTGQAELWRSESPALIIDRIEDFSLVSRTVEMVKAGGGRMKFGLLNGKPSPEDLRQLNALEITWHVIA